MGGSSAKTSNPWLSWTVKRLSILGFVAMVAGLVGLIRMHALLSWSPLVIAPQAAAVLLFLWARVVFGRRSFHAAATPTAGGLVTSGPYRFIRHPIYTSACLFVASSVGGHLSWATAICGGVLLGGALLRIHCEEILLKTTYPEYEQYATSTSRMIPYVY
jgi:protein-S-isoprenylcysteine O-methyltransferase Ste14